MNDGERMKVISRKKMFLIQTETADSNPARHGQKKIYNHS